MRQRAFDILDTLLSDNVNTRTMQSDTNYLLVSKRGKAAVNCQTLFAAKARKSVSELKKSEENKLLEPIRDMESVKRPKDE